MFYIIRTLPKPQRITLLLRTLLVLLAGLGVGPSPALSQPSEAEADYSPEALNQLVGPIALYPDDLVAIVLPASTYPVQIVQAARFLDEREADASLEPDPEWDNAVVALLNYPEVLKMMNEDLDWTWALGDAVLNAQAEVFDAIQDFRDQAYAAGNLRSDERQVVAEEDGVVSITPADPEVVYVPYYEPERVVVYQPYPVYHYYPYAYPLYYYPYPVGYPFATGFFWGVTSAFSIGWHTHYLHVYHHSHYGHPYYRRSYYTPYYARRGVNININLNHESHVWQPTYRRGARPYRYDGDVTRVRNSYRDGGGVRRTGTSRDAIDRRTAGDSRTRQGSVNRRAVDGVTRLTRDQRNARPAMQGRESTRPTDGSKVRGIGRVARQNPGQGRGASDDSARARGNPKRRAGSTVATTTRPQARSNASRNRSPANRSDASQGASPQRRSGSNRSISEAARTARALPRASNGDAARISNNAERANSNRASSARTLPQARNSGASALQSNRNQTARALPRTSSTRAARPQRSTPRSNRAAGGLAPSSRAAPQARSSSPPRQRASAPAPRSSRASNGTARASRSGPSQSGRSGRSQHSFAGSGSRRAR